MRQPLFVGPMTNILSPIGVSVRSNLHICTLNISKFKNLYSLNSEGVI